MGWLRDECSDAEFSVLKKGADLRLVLDRLCDRASFLCRCDAGQLPVPKRAAKPWVKCTTARCPKWGVKVYPAEGESVECAGCGALLTKRGPEAA